MNSQLPKKFRSVRLFADNAVTIVGTTDQVRMFQILSV